MQAEYRRPGEILGKDSQGSPIRLRSTLASSRKFGACESCGEHATEVFTLSLEGDCHFGHQDCMRGKAAAQVAS